MRVKNTKRKRIILSRIQKKAKIIELYEAGYTVSEICSIVHVSANTAQKVIREYEDSKGPKVKSKRSQALVLFDGELELLDVATELDIPVLEAEEYLREYLRAKNIDYLEQLRDQMGDDFLPFITLCKEMYLHSMGPEEIREARLLVEGLQTMRIELNQLSTEKQSKSKELENTYRKITKSQWKASELDKGILSLEKNFKSRLADQMKLNAEVEILNSKKSDLQSIIESKMDSEEICKKISAFTKNQVELVFTNRWESFAVLLQAIIQVFMQDKTGEFKTLVFQPYCNYFDSVLMSKLKMFVGNITKRIEPEVRRAVRDTMYEEIKQIMKDQKSQQLYESKMETNISEEETNSYSYYINKEESFSIIL